MALSAPISTLRLLVRIANSFTLDLLTIYRGERDFTDALIVSAFMQSESAHVAADEQQQYAVFSTPVPEHLRRPISINAIATSLNLPFETVRRRTKRLIAHGTCELTADGVRLADGFLGSEAHRLALDEAYSTVQGLYFRLRRADCLPLLELPAYASQFTVGAEPPVRIVWRASCEYFLRMMEILTPGFISLTQAFVIMEVVRANTERFSDDTRGGDSPDVEAFVPDSLRQPVRASAVAVRLGMPHETARRTLLLLVEDGRVQRLDDGYIVSAAVLARPVIVTAWTANLRNLGRMFGDLARSGVLARWDSDVGLVATGANLPKAG